MHAVHDTAADRAATDAAPTLGAITAV